MGSKWTVTLIVPSNANVQKLKAGVQAQFDRIDQQMSTWKADSDLSRFNRAPAGTWQALPLAFFRVLTQALKLAEQTQGAFDPTIGPVVELWGFGATGTKHRPPSDAEIAQALAKVGWQKVKLDTSQQRVYQAGGVQLDLSAIAKGFAVDEVSRWLSTQGVEHFLVNLSGEMRAQGLNAQHSAWQVAVERPNTAVAEAKGEDTMPYVIALDNQSVATSGDYRHRFTHEGNTYSHHLDPRTGYPVPYEVASVTVVADQCVDADPLGTTLTVLGAKKGMAWAHKNNLAVLMLVRTENNEFEELMTSAFEKLLVKGHK